MTYFVRQVTLLVTFIKGMGQELPLQTRMLLATSAFFVSYWYLILLTPVALVTTYKLLVPHNPQLQVDKLKLSLWPTGPILRKLILTRFANTFAMMYASGISGL